MCVLCWYVYRCYCTATDLSIFALNFAGRLHLIYHFGDYNTDVSISTVCHNASAGQRKLPWHPVHERDLTPLHKI